MAKPVRDRIAKEVRDALQPPVQYGELETYHAFLPGRNVGPRSVDNAPVVSRAGALALDAAIFTVVLVSALIALSVSTSQPWFLIGLFTYPALFYGWQTLFDVTGGTMGKRAMGLKVVGPAETPVDLGQTARRNAWLLLPMIPIAGPVVALGVGLWFAGVAKADAFGVAPHDRFARTRVVKKLG